MPSLFAARWRKGWGRSRSSSSALGPSPARIDPDAKYGVLGVAIAHAVVLSVMITATMADLRRPPQSRPHDRLSVARRRTPDAVSYIVAQLVGAVAGVLAASRPSSRFPSRANENGTPTIASTSSWAGRRHRGDPDFFLARRLRHLRESRSAEGRRLRRGSGAPLRHPGRRPAHRRGHEPGARVRPGAGGRAVGGALGLLGRPDPRRRSRPALLWEHVLLPKRERAG